MILITDRTQADVDAVKALRTKRLSDMTEEERTAWLSGMKGAYNAADLNRVQEAVEEIAQQLAENGYPVSVQRPTIIESVTPGEPIPVPNLPQGFTELKWIESTGSQYIDTGFEGNQNTRITMEVELTEEPSSTAVWLFGACRMNSMLMFGVVKTTDKLYKMAFNNTVTAVGGALTGHVSIDMNKNTCTINGETVTVASATIRTFGTITLLALNTNGTISNYAKAKLGKCKVYDDGVLLHDYTPCILDSTGVAGMYDAVGNRFVGSKSGTAFLAGELQEVPTIPGDPVVVTRDYWLVKDIADPANRALYLSNVQAVRDALSVLNTTPQVPQNMEAFTWVRANDIEQILADVSSLIEQLSLSMFRSGEM